MTDRTKEEMRNQRTGSIRSMFSSCIESGVPLHEVIDMSADALRDMGRVEEADIVAAVAAFSARRAAALKELARRVVAKVRHTSTDVDEECEADCLACYAEDSVLYWLGEAPPTP